MIKRCAVLFGAFTILFGTVPFYNTSAAVEGSTKFSVDVNQAVLELTVPTNPTVIDLNPTMTNTSFGTTNLTVKVATNNMTGYQLTMTPTNNTEDTSLIRTELVGDEQNYREIETLELTDPVSTGYTEQTFTANKWGYKITGDNYYGIDPENTTVSHPAWVTNAPTNGTNHNLTLAAKVDADTVSGAYETTLNFRAVTNSTVAKHTLSFDANGGTGTMNTVAITAGDSAALPANTFTPPTGMRFVGWATTQNGQGEGVKYYDNEATYVATDIGYNVNLTLYAQWTNSDTPTPQGGSSGTTPGTTLQRAYEIAYTAMHKGMYEEDDPGSDTYSYVDSWGSGHYQGNGRDVRFLIQDMTPEICASATAINSEAHVLDIRDNHSYWITKLADGRCWMTQNLNFYITGETLGHSTSDIGWSTDSTRTSWTPPTGAITENEAGKGWSFVRTPVSREPNNTVHRSSSAPFNYYNIVNSDGTTASFETLTDCINGGYSKEQCQHSYLGIYYNWAAATAVDSIPNPISPLTIMPDSICPAGWKLPLKSEYERLLSTLNEYHISTLKLPPFYFTGAWNTQGQRSWTSQATNNSDAYMLPEGGTEMTYWYMGGYEATMRCIAR